MRLPSCIFTMILRSMMAMDSSCFSVALRLATTSGSAGGRGWAKAAAVSRARIARVRIRPNQCIAFRGSSGFSLYLEFLHFWRRWVGHRGADTRVCRAETRLGAPPPFPGARPAIVLRPLDQPSLHGVVLDVRRDSFPFLFISDPMIVRLCLPKRFARTPPGHDSPPVAVLRHYADLLL